MILHYKLIAQSSSPSICKRVKPKIALAFTIITSFIIIKALFNNRRVIGQFFSNLGSNDSIPKTVGIRLGIEAHGMFAYAREGWANWLSNHILAYQLRDPLVQGHSVFWDALTFLAQKPTIPTDLTTQNGNPIYLKIQNMNFLFELDVHEGKSDDGSCIIYLQHTVGALKHFLPKTWDHQLAPIKKPLEMVLEQLIQRIAKEKIPLETLHFFFDDVRFRYCEEQYMDIIKRFKLKYGSRMGKLMSRTYSGGHFGFRGASENSIIERHEKGRSFARFTDIGNVNNAPNYGQSKALTCSPLHGYPFRDEESNVIVHGGCGINTIIGLNLLDPNKTIFISQDYIGLNTLNRVKELLEQIYQQTGEPDKSLDQRDSRSIFDFLFVWETPSYWSDKPYLFQLVLAANLKKPNGEMNEKFTGTELSKKLEQVPLGDFLAIVDSKSALATYVINPVDIKEVGMTILKQTIRAQQEIDPQREMFCAKDKFGQLPIDPLTYFSHDRVAEKELKLFMLEFMKQTLLCLKDSDRNIFRSKAERIFDYYFSLTAFESTKLEDLIFNLKFLVDNYQLLKNLKIEWYDTSLFSVDRLWRILQSKSEEFIYNMIKSTKEKNVLRQYLESCKITPHSSPRPNLKFIIYLMKLYDQDQSKFIQVLQVLFNNEFSTHYLSPMESTPKELYELMFELRDLCDIPAFRAIQRKFETLQNKKIPPYLMSLNPSPLNHNMKSVVTRSHFLRGSRERTNENQIDLTFQYFSIVFVLILGLLYINKKSYLRKVK